MSNTNENTSLLCLFHHEAHASAALEDLSGAGVLQSAVTSIAGPGAPDQLLAYGLPDRDRKLLEKSLQDGGILLAVNITPNQIDTVEHIFAAHSAKLVDEFDRKEKAEGIRPTAPTSLTTINAGQTLPIIEEELAVGKRTVDQGGVRVFRRVVEIPVSESVTLHEEHVVLDRHLVDREATAADLESGDRSIVLAETAEEIVVSKTARVIEEVIVRKQSSDRIEHVQDTVQHTEIDIEELPAETTQRLPKSN